MAVVAGERATFACGERDRRVDIGWDVIAHRSALREREAAWHDADDGERLAIEENSAADGRRIPLELAGPQRVAEHGDGLRALVLFACERTTERRLHAKR